MSMSRGMGVSESRQAILAGVRASLGRKVDDTVAPRPPVVPPRAAGDDASELALLLSEIEKLGGVTRRLADGDELQQSLQQLVVAERVQRATVWATDEMSELGVSAMLAELGVELVSPREGKSRIAECDLGVTGVDAALPETGTLALRSDANRPRAVSLVPRVHLAIVRPAALRADLHQLFAEAKQGSYLICITGPSRTADIELTVTIGVHGPKALYVWLLP